MRITATQIINQFNVTSTQEVYQYRVTSTQEVYQYRITVSQMGTSGLSAYNIAVINGFIGTQEEWLESLGGQNASLDSWIYYTSTWDTPPEFIENITNGSVYRYIQNATIRYRFVPSPYIPSQDAFYSIYNSPILSGLIVSR